MVLLVFNYSAHPTTKGLTNIHIIFLPPNTTVAIQPMDQGMIRSLKVLYWKRVVRELFGALDKNVSLPKVSVVDACFIEHGLIEHAFVEHACFIVECCFEWDICQPF